MSGLLDAASWVVAGAATVPCLVLSGEIALGLAGCPDRTTPAPAARVAVIVPAHDEAAVIEGSLRALMAAVPPGTRILVVADNCSDATAAIARGTGADVIERTDRERRGKGYALAFARDHLAAGLPGTQPEVVLVLDADCRLAPGSVERLAGSCLATGRPAQARNLLTAPGGEASPLVQISCFAFALKNLVRARGLQRMAGAITLMGTGMAFPWPMFARLPLASGHLAEDMELGVELIRQGQGAVLVPAASVTSPHAARADTLEQRKRWEHGFLSVAARQALPLLGEGLARRRSSLIALGLDLLVPPLALMGVLVLGAGVVLALAWLAGASAAPLIALGASAGLAGVLVLAAWAAMGRALLRPGALLRVPLYIIWKLPLYLRFLGRRETRWVRTRRPGSERG